MTKPSLPQAFITEYTTVPSLRAWCQRTGASPLALCSHVLCWRVAPYTAVGFDGMTMGGH